MNLSFLNKLKLEKIGALDKNKIIFIALGVVLLLYLDFAFILKLQYGYARSAGAKIMKLKGDLDILAKDLVRLKDLQAAGGKEKQAQALGVKKIISQGEIPLLLGVISDMAKKNNFSVMQIKPFRELKAKADKEQGTFMPVSITLVLSCAYHSLGQFINDLENGEYFIAVEEARITPAAGYRTQNVNLRLKTYVK